MKPTQVGHRTKKTSQTHRGRKSCFLQDERLVPFRTRGAVRLSRAARLALCCHLHINGSPKQALLPLDFGTGNWSWIYIYIYKKV